MFELIRRDGLARIGKLETPHGQLETPALLPVVNPRLVTVPPRELHDVFGFQALITNSYIIRNDPKLNARAKEVGLHEMLDFPGTIMTDSGTFQSHMYGEVEVRNEDIINFQRDIGTDIGTVLDIFTEPDWSKEKTAHAVDVTMFPPRWFLPYDAFFQLLTAFVALAVALYALRGHKWVKEKILYNLFLAFLLLSVGLLINGVTLAYAYALRVPFTAPSGPLVMYSLLVIPMLSRPLNSSV